VDEVALELGFPPSFFGVLLIIIILPLLHTHLSPPYEIYSYSSVGEAAHYYIFGL
jgi:hypothetical protein